LVGVVGERDAADQLHGEVIYAAAVVRALRAAYADAGLHARARATARAGPRPAAIVSERGDGERRSDAGTQRRSNEVTERRRDGETKCGECKAPLCRRGEHRRPGGASGTAASIRTRSASERRRKAAFPPYARPPGIGLRKKVESARSRRPARRFLRSSAVTEGARRKRTPPAEPRR
jgi:hypothetical protein